MPRPTWPRFSIACEQWQPDAILYVVDHRQSLHFEQLFAIARLWGYDNVEFAARQLRHGAGRRRPAFQNPRGRHGGAGGTAGRGGRSGAHRSSATTTMPSPTGRNFRPEERQAVAEAVGIACMKYADLSQNRTSDYEFSYDKMLAMNGNTATYMQYAYARVRSIFRRGQGRHRSACAAAAAIVLDSPAERGLARQLLRFCEALDATVADYRPNQLTSYLFELANGYSTFFEQCRCFEGRNARAARQPAAALRFDGPHDPARDWSCWAFAVVEKM